MNANGFINPFPPAGQAGENAGDTLNANGQMYNIQDRRRRRQRRRRQGIGGFQGPGGIYPLPTAVGYGLGGVAAPNAAYVAWAAQQAMLGQQWAAGGRAGGTNGPGG